MIQKDAELIRQVLQGNQEAFGLLVKKYQKGVHALAWRKIGDFHIAQEITQDAFFKAYEKLETLKNHNLFAGWLYVIAARLCADWFQKNSLPEQSLEVTDVSEVNKVSYSRYVAEKQADEADETRREVVKKLLQKLPESERTVMTLHYLGEMTIKAISEFLGVSPNTVKSRLSRARNRLRKEEDMIQHNLGSFQLPTNLTENIMREISRIAPTAPAVNKPMIPWVLSAASAVLIFLLIGVGTQYLSRFQKPYDLNATSERTVEIIEAAFVLDSPAKPAVRNQAGNSIIPGRSPGAGQKADARLFAAALVDETEISTPKSQWIQTKGPEGGIVNTLFATTSGDIYAGTPTSLYKLSDDQTAWKLVNTGSSASLNIQEWLMSGGQMTERNDTLYIATETKVLASTDSGETWNSLGAHPKGMPRGLVITDSGFYLGLVKGVFHSPDDGVSWIALEDGLEAKEVRALVAVENTVFAGTENGLYRLNADIWDKISIPPAGIHGETLAIHALAVTEHRLYVAAGTEFTEGLGTQLKTVLTSNDWWSLYRSTDSGDSWYAIDPRQRLDSEKERKSKGRFSVSFPLPGANTGKEDDAVVMPSKIKIVAAEEKVMLIDSEEIFYSMNTGETWTSLDLSNNSGNLVPPILMLDANTFYRGTGTGILRTTDGGKSWHQFNTGLVNATVMTLIAANGKLYANSMDGFVTSIDGGESWTLLPGSLDHGVFIKAFDDVLYVKRGNHMNSPSPLLRLSTKDHNIKFIDGMPAFKKINSHKTDEEMSKIMMEAFSDIGKQNLEEGVPPNPEDVDFEQLNETLNKALQAQAASSMMAFLGSFAVSGDTYYVEYMQKLFKWKPGMTEWYDTGLIDETQTDFLPDFFDYSADISEALDFADSFGFKLAVSGKTIYVGKQDGHLFQSFDEADTWTDVTENLPFSVASFNAIAIAGSTVYVATDKGVAYSRDGIHWHSITDAQGNPLVVARLTVEETTVYGQAEQYVYQLKEGSNVWKQDTPEIPSPVTHIVVDGNTLYVGTFNRGVLRFTLNE